MLIAAFARRAGLTTDTVRYYMRLGLLRPEAGGKGGQRPYAIFTDEHLLAARIIRTAQSLGMSLKEVAAISQERRAGDITPARRVAILQAQLERVEAKAAEVAAMASYLRAKIAWMQGGENGPPPDFAGG